MPCRHLLAAGGAVLVLALAAVSPGQNKAGVQFFTDRVAPLLKQRCLECHSGPKARNGLDLSTREHLLAGGDSGPAVVPGDAAKSFLIKMVSGPKAKMPQKGEPLSAA